MVRASDVNGNHFQASGAEVFVGGEVGVVGMFVASSIIMSGVEEGL